VAWQPVHGLTTAGRWARMSPARRRTASLYDRKVTSSESAGLAVFPATRGSVVLAARDPDPAVRHRGFDRLAASYWKPVYKYLRVQWRMAPEDAEDLAQGFFARAFEKQTFASFQPDRARFRTFLRVCLDRFVANELKAARRAKRGGGAQPLALAARFAGAEGELARQEPADPGLGMEEYFHREWARNLFSLAVEDLRRELEAKGQAVRFTLFARYDLDESEDPANPANPDERPTYAALGTPFGLNGVQVTNQLAAARRDLRRLVLERLREATGSEAEFRAEASSLLGVALP